MMSDLSSTSDDASDSCDTPQVYRLRHPPPSPTRHSPPPLKRKRNLPGTPDPDAEVIALSPRTLLATNRFGCDICGRGFPRFQNLQLHLRLHKQPWELRQRGSKEIRRRVYICPEESCVHHERSRALGDLTGIKKHFSRKHGEKRWTCEKCAKRYAVHSDWKAHSKICGNREYCCDICGELFTRKDKYKNHRTYCVALARESAALGGGHSAAMRCGSSVMETAQSTVNSALPALNTSSLELHRHGLSLRTASMDQHPAARSESPSSASELSLCLGHGPGHGPGPPNHGQLLGIHREWSNHLLNPGCAVSTTGLVSRLTSPYENTSQMLSPVYRQPRIRMIQMSSTALVQTGLKNRAPATNASCLVRGLGTTGHSDTPCWQQCRFEGVTRGVDFDAVGFMHSDPSDFCSGPQKCRLTQHLQRSGDDYTHTEELGRENGTLLQLCVPLSDRAGRVPQIPEELASHIRPPSSFVTTSNCVLGSPSVAGEDGSSVSLTRDFLGLAGQVMAS